MINLVFLKIKFGIEDFTDPDLLKIRLTLNGLLLWFCLHKCFLTQGKVLLLLRKVTAQCI